MCLDKPWYSNLSTYGELGACYLLYVVLDCTLCFNLTIPLHVSVFISRRVVIKHRKRCHIVNDGVEAVTTQLYFTIAFVGLANLVLKASASEVFVKSFKCFHLVQCLYRLFILFN